MNATPSTNNQEFYDTELHCNTCGTRLYLSATDATLVLAALQQTGKAGLCCMCGALLIIGPDLLPLWPLTARTND